MGMRDGDELWQGTGTRAPLIPDSMSHNSREALDVPGCQGSFSVTCANLARKPFVSDPSQLLDGNSLGEVVQPWPMVPLMDGEARAKTQPQDVTSFSSGST